MPRYAKTTTVPVDRSKAEIEETLKLYKASEFHSGWKVDAAMIAFRLDNLFIRFVLPLPSQKERRFTHKLERSGREELRAGNQAYKVWEQEIRQRWRALLLSIKGKLEAVECGISTIQQEFLSYVVMPNDITVGEWMMSGPLPAILAGKMPLLLEAPKNDDSILDAEIERKP